MNDFEDLSLAWVAGNTIVLYICCSSLGEDYIFPPISISLMLDLAVKLILANLLSMV